MRQVKQWWQSNCWKHPLFNGQIWCWWRTYSWLVNVCGWIPHQILSYLLSKEESSWTGRWRSLEHQDWPQEPNIPSNHFNLKERIKDMVGTSPRKNKSVTTEIFKILSQWKAKKGHNFSSVLGAIDCIRMTQSLRGSRAG